MEYLRAAKSPGECVTESMNVCNSSRVCRMLKRCPQSAENLIFPERLIDLNMKLLGGDGLDDILTFTLPEIINTSQKKPIWFYPES